MEWLLVGLGNPGPEYAGTRHNVGFMVIDALRDRYGAPLKRSKHQSIFGEARIEGVQVVLAKPMTFMNLSGRAVAPLMREFGLPLDRLLVIADEVDLPLGKIRMRSEGGAGGHNGHKSIIQSLGSNQYARLRIGVGRSEAGDTADHVLSRFLPEERSIVGEVLVRAVESCVALLTLGIDRAMQITNSGGEAFGEGAAPD
ncbi:MAG: aminoacyl-tRNA hydrolase [Armatimonadetes bacterium]|nr:MAG: aminoacyl-tRNA hydrolase [Armatimonadota bacterium]MBL1151680.1 aminoacyl-tRNA hydrolase [Armatimonadota bacterium]NOG38338.1 aminoacyl-tRNA hydrolase [Armatimonadota bacterium]